MNIYPQESVTRVWLLLLAITLGSWALGSNLLGERGGQLALVAILALSLVKAQLVILHFMEVRHAPGWIRHLCNVWLATVFGALLWLYS